jgi:asparagine synthase (glutamine-hydrolysing)
MTAALAHRGPDGERVVGLGSAALGHRRLAIVDRSRTGEQPMSGRGGTLWVVYNGEIYNYLDKRQELVRRGYRFTSRSDTEVLVALYEEYGEACVDHLHGMFAFAIWDARDRKLFAARDRFGKKPFYYRVTEGRFSFASEIKGLLAERDPIPAIEPEAIHHFLSFDYVPGPRTAFKGILKLAAGHRLVYERGQIRIEPYFTPQYTPRDAGLDAKDVEERLRALLGAAVERRLMGEVPVGVFLSGGLDSSAIVALLAGQGHRELNTFSIRFADADYDEGPHARTVAHRFGTTHHEIDVTPDLASELPRIVRQYDEPFGDSSSLPTYFLAREARRSITVALTGDGGDEAFAGYDRYLWMSAAKRYLQVPRLLRAAAARVVGALVPESLPFDHPIRQIARFAALDPASLEDQYCRWMLHFDSPGKKALYTRGFDSAVVEDSCTLMKTWFARAHAADLLGTELAVDAQSYLPDDLLVKTDISTMAHGLEARCPFLDQEVASFAAGLPSDFKLRGRTTKWILRRAFRGLLPDEILERPKRGFAMPVGRWLRQELRPLVQDLVLGRRAIERGYFEADALRRLVDQHESGGFGWQHHLWNLLVLEIWHREVIDVHGQAARHAEEPRSVYTSPP